MLIITRHVDESVMIGSDIQVKVLSVRGCSVRIGIQAPSHVAVHREELARRLALASPTHEAPSLARQTRK